MSRPISGTRKTSTPTDASRATDQVSGTGFASPRVTTAMFVPEPLTATTRWVTSLPFNAGSMNETTCPGRTFAAGSEWVTRRSPASIAGRMLPE